jgi:hypothetical protein
MLFAIGPYLKQELNITWDSASWDVSASHFLRSPRPGGFSANGEEREDDFHGMWNAFNWCLDRAQIKFSCVQMYGS